MLPSRDDTTICIDRPRRHGNFRQIDSGNHLVAKILVYLGAPCDFLKF
jgi:hypothetical protein